MSTKLEDELTAFLELYHAYWESVRYPNDPKPYGVWGERALGSMASWQAAFEGPREDHPFFATAFLHLTLICNHPVPSPLRGGGTVDSWGRGAAAGAERRGAARCSSSRD